MRPLETPLHALMVASILALCLFACAPSTTPQVTAGVDECTYCHMVIDKVNQAAGYVRDRGFVPFDSPACLLARYEELRKAREPLPKAVYFADSESGEFQPAEATTFLLTRHHPTVMGGEVLAFGSRAAAEAIRQHDDEVVTDWIGYRTARGKPDRKITVSLGPDGLSPDKVEVEKDELVEWTVRAAEGVADAVVLSVKGYPELEAVTVTAEEPASFRLLAVRPGDGFPIVEGATGEVLGVIVVRGAHTADEEAEGM